MGEEKKKRPRVVPLDLSMGFLRVPTSPRPRVLFNLYFHLK